MLITLNRSDLRGQSCAHEQSGQNRSTAKLPPQSGLTCSLARTELSRPTMRLCRTYAGPRAARFTNPHTMMPVCLGLGILQTNRLVVFLPDCLSESQHRLHERTRRSIVNELLYHTQRGGDVHLPHTPNAQHRGQDDHQYSQTRCKD